MFHCFFCCSCFLFLKSTSSQVHALSRFYLLILPLIKDLRYKYTEIYITYRSLKRRKANLTNKQIYSQVIIKPRTYKVKISLTLHLLFSIQLSQKLDLSSRHVSFITQELFSINFSTRETFYGSLEIEKSLSNLS